MKINMKINKPTLEEVNDTDLSPVYGLYNFFPEVENGDINYLDKKAGVEHYKLLGWLSNQFNNIIISEVGTCDGMGLLALSLNLNNKVISYDVYDYPKKHKIPKNGERRFCNPDFDHFDEIIKSTIIFYDANHNGVTEQNFTNKLIELEWKGILIFDDIFYTEGMRNFWNNLSVTKEDWSDIGHSGESCGLECGTGIVFLNL